MIRTIFSTPLMKAYQHTRLIRAPMVPSVIVNAFIEQ